jgi:FKBP-type peptidyl-prolyl cis-trans isomerase SlyD
MGITKNTLVKLDYTMTDSEGNSLNPDNELIYLQGGYGFVFAKVEEALEGKTVGDTVRVELTPAEAFGEFDEGLVVEEPLSDLPEDIAVGMEIDGYFDENPDDVVIYTVTQIRGESAVLDANHPLAGKALVFEGTVEEVQELDDAAVKEILEHKEHHHHDH